MRYRFTCEYNGAAFSGWQEQPNEKTVQGELEAAFSVALRQKIRITGAGRTDAGVHARGQVAHFDFEGEGFIPRTLENSVNALSDKNVCIRNLEQCQSDFHARYSAKERYYQYTICTQPIVLGAELVWQCGCKLDTALMEEEAKIFLGEHNFNAFSIPRNDGKSTVCMVTEFRLDHTMQTWHIRGNRFLHRQVRSMIGLLFDVGRGRFEPGAAKRIFNGEFIGERTWAPAQGLVLADVTFDCVSQC
ncbi:MAG: tRNA pseudouridine(38-40) synthase TruA [Fibromonadales bacterium]|nr:tRNA pseudouridine(38-40) synthase TruA [Fibromonadales bacterium]